MRTFLEACFCIVVLVGMVLSAQRPVVQDWRRDQVPAFDAQPPTLRLDIRVVGDRIIRWSVVQDGRTATYSIDLDEAVMSSGDERRKFDPEETLAVKGGLKAKTKVPIEVWNFVLARYVMQSAVWWSNGQGERLDK